MTGLILLALGTIAFVGTHLAMSHPYRTRLVGQLGEAGFQIAYSIVSVITLGWMIWAYGDADYEYVYRINNDLVNASQTAKTGAVCECQQCC